MTETEKTLKVTAIDFDEGLWRSSMKSIDEIPADQALDLSDGWYLDGKLELMVGYDLAIPTNAIDCGLYAETVFRFVGEQPRVCRQFCCDGIVNVEVEGVNEPCIGIFWVIPTGFRPANGRLYPTWEQKGFVCLESDEAAVAHAIASRR